MEHYKRLASIIRDADDDGVVQYLSNLTPCEMAHVVRYLTEYKMTQDGCREAYMTRKKMEYGVSPQWQATKNDPEAYRRKLEYNRIYKAKKRAEERMTRGVAQPTV